MARFLKVLIVDSEGQHVTEPTIEHVVLDEAGEPYLNDDGTPNVVVTLRPIDTGVHRRIEQKHTQRVANPRTRAMEERSDTNKIIDDLVQYCILDWRGILGADGKALVCNDATKLALDQTVKNQLVQRAIRTETVEVREASFRQSPDVLRVVRRLGQDGDVLSEGH